MRRLLLHLRSLSFTSKLDNGSLSLSSQPRITFFFFFYTFSLLAERRKQRRALPHQLLSQPLPPPRPTRGCNA